jgi:hypothetical protein
MQARPRASRGRCGAAGGRLAQRHAIPGLSSTPSQASRPVRRQACKQRTRRLRVPERPNSTETIAAKSRKHPQMCRCAAAAGLCRHAASKSFPMMGQSEGQLPPQRTRSPAAGIATATSGAREVTITWASTTSRNVHAVVSCAAWSRWDGTPSTGVATATARTAVAAAAMELVQRTDSLRCRSSLGDSRY